MYHHVHATQRLQFSFQFTRPFRLSIARELSLKLRYPITSSLCKTIPHWSNYSVFVYCNVYATDLWVRLYLTMLSTLPSLTTRKIKRKLRRRTDQRTKKKQSSTTTRGFKTEYEKDGKSNKNDQRSKEI